MEEEERKVALVLEAGLRADRPAAERLLADCFLRHRSLAGWQQHVEALRMYNYSLASVGSNSLRLAIRSSLIPRLEFVALHACAASASHRARHASFHHDTLCSF